MHLVHLHLVNAEETYLPLVLMPSEWVQEIAALAERQLTFSKNAHISAVVL